MNKNDVVINFIKIIDDNRNNKIKKFSLNELNFIIKFARDNEILLTFLDKYFGAGYINIETIKKLKEYEGIKQKKLLNTITEVNRIFNNNNIEFFYIKLYKHHDYIPRDIDLMIFDKDLKKALILLEENGYEIKSHESGVENQCIKEGRVNLDIYQGFYYLGGKYFDNDFIWKNKRKVSFSGLDIPVPCKEADLLMLYIHALLGHRNLSLIDFLYAKELLNDSEINFEDVQNQLKKYQWLKAFYSLSNLVEEKKKQIFKNYSDSINNSDINFPIPFSSQYLLSLFSSSHFVNMSGLKKILFINSTLIDNLMYRYLLLRRSYGWEIPIYLREYIMVLLHKVRKYTGDRKVHKNKLIQ